MLHYNPLSQLETILVGGYSLLGSAARNNASQHSVISTEDLVIIGLATISVGALFAGVGYLISKYSSS